VSTARFALVTLLAWTTTASLFVILKRAPLTRGVSIAYYIPLCSILPWLAGYVFWFKVKKRAKLGIADRDTTRFCCEIIIMAIGAAYVAMVSIDGVLLWALTRVK